ncbi:hypothetical protein FRC00_007968 [Tulasnella sp. 408]|nr:hypothetical protein FRC00_007968 [Tulasnella sp. 408]
MDLRLRSMADFKALIASAIDQDVIKHVRHRNALLPIGKLPIELLQTIFSIILFYPSGRRKSQFVSRLTTLRAVSWSWQDLIGRTPSFWAHVSSEDHMDFVSEAFNKSGQVPIHLYHIGRYNDGQESPFLDKLLPHVHRWQSVVVHQPRVDVAAKYVSASAPKIKSILLSALMFDSPQQTHIGSLFGGSLADLEELRVSCWGDIDWTGLNCTRLRILDIGRGNSLDIDAVLGILAANPCLKILRLHQLEFSPNPPQPDSTPALISLDHLRQLTLVQLKWAREGEFSQSTPAADHLFQRINFPIDAALTITTYLPIDSSFKPEEFLSRIPSPVEYLAFLLQVDDFQRADVSVEFRGAILSLIIRESPRSKPIYSFAVSGRPNPVAKEWVRESLQQSLTTPMDLRLQFQRGASGFSLDDVSYFQLWDSVIDLTLAGHDHSLAPSTTGRNLLRLLSTPCMSEAGIMVMPFPKLQHLHIDGPGGSGIKGKSVLDMVQTRFAPPGSTEAAVHSSVPVPLTIHFGNGVGGWMNKYKDKILAVPGVEGIEVASVHETPWDDRRTSPSSSEAEWPPPYDDGETSSDW